MDSLRSNGVLRLDSNSIVIRSRVIDRKFDGGRAAFYKKYPPEMANRNLVVFKSKGSKARKIFRCFERRGFVYGADFVFVDIELFSRGNNSYPFPLDPEVKWIKGRYKDGTVPIKYISGRKRSGRRNRFPHSARDSGYRTQRTEKRRHPKRTFNIRSSSNLAIIKAKT